LLRRSSSEGLCTPVPSARPESRTPRRAVCRTSSEGLCTPVPSARPESRTPRRAVSPGFSGESLRGPARDFDEVYTAVRAVAGRSSPLPGLRSEVVHKQILRGLCTPASPGRAESRTPRHSSSPGLLAEDRRERARGFDLGTWAESKKHRCAQDRFRRCDYGPSSPLRGRFLYTSRAAPGWSTACSDRASPLRGTVGRGKRQKAGAPRAQDRYRRCVTARVRPRRSRKPLESTACSRGNHH